MLSGIPYVSSEQVRRAASTELEWKRPFIVARAVMSSGRHVLLATDLDEVYGLTVNGGEPVFIRRASAPGRVVSTTKSVGICGSRAVTSGR